MKNTRARRFAICLIPVLALAIPAHDTSAERKQSWTELVQLLSEPGGYFDSDNLVSNESSYLTVLSRIRDLNIHGGVYVGVGPDQNFSYMAEIRPEMAIIIDIRRQNMLQHILFKALMERARSRLEYLGLLFSKPVNLPADLGRSLTAEQLLASIDEVESDPAIYQGNLEWIRRWVARKLRFPLTDQDYQVLAYIHRNFTEFKLDLRYKSYGRDFPWRYPTFRSLVLERDLRGGYGNYLASEERFQWLKKFQEEDRLIPVVGDLGGKLAMRKVAQYLRQQHRQVRAFYVSNVEFYLMRSGGFEGYVENVRQLPVGDTSIFIRSFFGYGTRHPEQVDGYWMASVLQYIRSFLQEHDRSPYYSNRDLAMRDYISLHGEH